MRKGDQRACDYQRLIFQLSGPRTLAFSLSQQGALYICAALLGGLSTQLLSFISCSNDFSTELPARRVSQLPITMSFIFARDKATFNLLLSSRRRPVLPAELLLANDKITTSLSLPWYLSTVLTSRPSFIVLLMQGSSDMRLTYLEEQNKFLRLVMTIKLYFSSSQSLNAFAYLCSIWTYNCYRRRGEAANQ